MKSRFPCLLLFALFLSLFPVVHAQYTPQCDPGFVWSRVSNQCVQEICPADAIGRDQQEQCLCSPATHAVQEEGLLIACAPNEARPVRVSNIPQAASVPLLVATATPVRITAPIATSTLLQDASSTRAVLRSRGIVWPIAAPSTITLLFLIAVGIGYYLKTHPAKK